MNVQNTTSAQKIHTEQYKTPSNLEVRQAFNTLPKEDTTDIWVRLGNYYKDNGVLDIEGDTLEVGGGNGHLWKTTKELFFDAMAKQGQIHVTDFSQGMVDACKNIESLNIPQVTLRTADVTRLEDKDASFARVIGNFMMYELKNDDAVEKGVKEIARVLKDDGRALILTMDEKIHMIELWQICQKAKETVQKQGIAIDMDVPPYSPAILPFCAGNAPGFLGKAFDSVTAKTLPNKISVHEHVETPKYSGSGPEFVVLYLKSLEFIHKNNPPEAYFDAIRTIVSDEIKKNGVFTISRCEVLYDCAQPKRNIEASTLHDVNQKV